MDLYNHEQNINNNSVNHVINEECSDQQNLVLNNVQITDQYNQEINSNDISGNHDINEVNHENQNSILNTIDLNNQEQNRNNVSALITTDFSFLTKFDQHIQTDINNRKISQQVSTSQKCSIINTNLLSNEITTVQNPKNIIYNFSLKKNFLIIDYMFQNFVTNSVGIEINSQNNSSFKQNFTVSTKSNLVSKFNQIKLRKQRKQIECYIARTNNTQRYNIFVPNDLENEKEIINLVFLIFKIIIEFQSSKFL